MENQLHQENYLVKTSEIELCPNQAKEAPPKFGWNSDTDDQESESDTAASDELEDIEEPIDVEGHEDIEVPNDGENPSESSSQHSSENDKLIF